MLCLENKLTKNLKNAIIRCKEKVMSRKKSKKVKFQLIKPVSERENVVDAPQIEIPEPPPMTEPQQALPAPSPVMTKEQQMARMLFDDFFKNGLNIVEHYENDKIAITPFKRGELQVGGGDEIECYCIVPKSNSNVAVYIDKDSICVSLLKDRKYNSLNLKDNELIYLATNLLTYAKDAYVPKAA